MHGERGVGGRGRRRRPGELTAWLVCALFGVGMGYAAAANFGEVFEAVGGFVRSVDRAHEARPQFGDGLLNDRAPAQLSWTAAVPEKAKRIFWDAIPSSALSVSAEPSALLTPGARLVLRGRLSAALVPPGAR